MKQHPSIAAPAHRPSGGPGPTLPVAPPATCRIRPFRLEADSPTIHRWVNRDYARYWGMASTTEAQVKAAYAEVLKQASVYIGEFVPGQPAFLFETYDPATDLIGNYYPVQPGDRGMHVLVAPADTPVRGFTWRVFTCVMDFLFSDAAVQRVVVEPDVRNEKIHVLNKKAGFVYQDVVQLPHKTAHLAFCTREQYTRACRPFRIPL